MCVCVWGGGGGVNKLGRVQQAWARPPAKPRHETQIAAGSKVSMAEPLSEASLICAILYLCLQNLFFSLNT